MLLALTRLLRLYKGNFCKALGLATDTLTAALDCLATIVSMSVVKPDAFQTLPL